MNQHIRCYEIEAVDVFVIKVLTFEQYNYISKRDESHSIDTPISLHSVLLEHMHAVCNAASE